MVPCDADHQRIVKTSQVGASAGGGAEVIVDNTDANTSQVGTWSVSSASGAYGTNSVYRDSAGTFRWTPNLPAQGAYKVYARWTYHSNRGTQVPYRVTHSAGTSEIIVNQHDQSLGGEWVLLGTYEFAAGSAGYVEVSAESGQANADAVKFVQVDSANTGTTITHYLGKGYERVQTPTGVVEHKHYISAGGTTVLYTQRSNAANDTRYLHKDHLGSTDVITDEQGQVIERLSFDAWGARRNPNWTNAPNYGFHLTSLVTRGFTGHNQDDAVGLIDMNARLYDAKLGRFLQPDTFVQHPYTTQGMNRYTYVNNNPLSFTDPTGHFLKKLFKGIKKLFKNKIFRAVVGIVVAAVTGFWVADKFFWAQAAAGTFNTVAGLSMQAGILGGAAGGFAGGLIASGGDLKSAFIGAFSGAMAGAIGGYFGHDVWSVEKVLAHGVSGGVSSELAGGEFRHGFSAALFSSALSPLSNGRTGVAKTTIAAVIGGTASKLAGGKFANGAMTSSFVSLFNDQFVGYGRHRHNRDGTITETRHVNGKSYDVVTVHALPECKANNCNVVWSRSREYELAVDVKAAQDLQTGANWASVVGGPQVAAFASPIGLAATAWESYMTDSYRPLQNWGISRATGIRMRQLDMPPGIRSRVEAAINEALGSR